jgi:hypothetical protein
MTTPLKTRASILVEWFQLTGDEPQYKEFFAYNDLGIALAIAMNSEACTPTKTGVFVLEKTWEQLCEWQLQDPEGNYKSLEDMLPNFDLSLGDEDEDEDEDEDDVELLQVLAKDEDEYVRIWVARNANCSLELLQVLAKDKHVRVRGSVAMNRNTPNRVLEDLAKDKEVSQYLSAHLSAQKEIADLFR